MHLINNLIEKIIYFSTGKMFAVIQWSKVIFARMQKEALLRTLPLNLR